ncbi:hypothetical protein Tco_1274479 [Tanacetum coccineum]
MLPRMTTRSTGRQTATPRGGSTGGQTGRGGKRTGEPTSRVVGRTSDQGGQGGDPGNHISNIQCDVRSTKVSNGRNGCSYKEFMACNPKDYDGNGGAIVYIRWIEKIDTVQDISGCGANQKVKYTAGSFIVSMTWEDFKDLTRKKFCPNNEMQTEFWCHAMVRPGHAAYTNHFHELARLVPNLVTFENKRIERYTYGLTLQICAMVAATKPIIIQSAVLKARMLTDEAIRNGR